MRLGADVAAFCDLPAAPFEPCEKRASKVSSTALVRYRSNDYSVPTAFGFRDVLVKGFTVDEVVIVCTVPTWFARHPRLYGHVWRVRLRSPALPGTSRAEARRTRPSRTVAGLDPAREPAASTTGCLRADGHARQAGAGFIQVLRLMEAFPQAGVAAAAKDAPSGSAQSASTRSSNSFWPVWNSGRCGA